MSESESGSESVSDSGDDDGSSSVYVGDAIKSAVKAKSKDVAIVKVKQARRHKVNLLQKKQ